MTQPQPSTRRLLESIAASSQAQLVRAQQDGGFNEAVIDKAKREVRVILISEGPGNSRDKNYYSAEAIKDAVTKFNGARAYLDHQTADEDFARPEQSIKNLAAFYKDTALVEVKDAKTGKTVPAVAATMVCAETPAGDIALAVAETEVLHRQLFPESQDCFSGISINSGGWQEGDIDIDGQSYAKIVGFEAVRSADIVTRPARGGQFLELLESVAPEGAITRHKEQAMTKAEKIKKLLPKLEEAQKAVGAAGADKLEAAKAEVKRLQTELVKTLEEADAPADPAAKKPEEGDINADKTAAPTDGPAADPLAALVPKMTDEADEAYTERLGKIKAAMAPAKPEGEAAPAPTETKPATESARVKAFRESQPLLHRELAAQIRESLGEERKDFAGVKAQLKEASARIVNLEADIALERCSRELAEAGIGEDVLAAGDLVKLDPAARTRLIARTKMSVESVAQVWGGGTFPGTAPAGGADKGVSKMLAESGVPMVKKD